jgi:site-specific recombinase XerD
LPIYLPADAIERIIESCDRSTPSGLRDRAVLLLFARLGLRAGDVANLRLGDIDWKTGRFRVIGKGRREAWLPLPQDAGDAVHAYLQRARPAASDDHVFLKVQAPIAACSASSLSYRVAEAIRRAGVDAPAHGAHLLRHSLATRMLREGATLDSIGVLLRHQDVETTALYSKVDVELLRQVAQPWPVAEVSPC